MKNKLLQISSFVLLIFIFSCKEKIHKLDDFKLKFKDNFESSLKEFWYKEIADSTRIKIVSDPLNKKNNVLKITLSPGNVVSKGKYSKGFRSEIVAIPKDSINSITKYSFKFMVDESFFKKDELQGWITIHQWHDYPPIGHTWGYAFTNPPYNLYIQHNPNGDYYLEFSGGIRVNKIDKRSILTYYKKLKPNHWYTFKNEIKWHVYDNKSYCKPKLDGKPFSIKKNVKIYKTRNMYNPKPNSYKMGLYWSNAETRERTIYFDDFKLESKNLN